MDLETAMLPIADSLQAQLREVGEALRCDSRLARSDTDMFIMESLYNLSVANFVPFSAQHKNKNGVASTSADREAPLNPDPREKKTEEASLNPDPREKKTEEASKITPIQIEDRHQLLFQAAQQQATYATAAHVQEIQAVLNSCTRRNDSITIDDMDLVHEKFGAFMRSHPTLSESFIRLTGGIVNLNLPALVPPPALVPAPPPPPPPPSTWLESQPAYFHQQEVPPLWTIDNSYQPTMPSNFYPNGFHDGPFANGVAEGTHHEYAPVVNGEQFYYERSCESPKNNYLANNDAPLLDLEDLDTRNTYKALLDKALLQISACCTEPTPSAFIPDEETNKECSQSTKFAAALLSLLQQHAQPSTEIDASPTAPAAIDVQDIPHSSITLPRTTNRNLRRMGLNPTEELLPGLPDRRPYTRPVKPYQGPPRGRPVGSGRKRRRNKSDISGGVSKRIVE